MATAAPAPPPAGPPAAAAQDRRQRQRGSESSRFGPRSVAWAGALVALALLLLLAAFLARDRQNRLHAGMARSELMSRVLADHASRNLDGVSLVMSMLGTQLVLLPRDRWSAHLQQALPGPALLRGLAVLDAQGTVLASSEPDLGPRRFNLAPLGPLPTGQRSTMGAVRVVGAAQAPHWVQLQPLSAAHSGPALWLLGAVDANAWAQAQQALLADPHSRALLLSPQGGVLAATPHADADPAWAAPAWLTTLLQTPGAAPARSHIDAGTRAGPQLLARHRLATQPLVVVVETPLQQALAGWRRDAAKLGAVVALAVGLVALMTQLAVKSLHAREAARRQRNAAQAQVAQRERELSVIFESVQEVLFRTDADGRLVFVNARWAKASGVEEDQALGRALADLVRPAYAGVAQALFSAEGKARTRTAHVRMGPDGDGRDFELAVSPLRATDRLLGFAGSAIDVTEQRRTQGLLRSQLAFTELLLDALPLPLCILNAQGRYASVNQAWQDFTGRKREDVLGKLARAALPEAEAQEDAERDRQLLAQGGRLRYGAVALHRDGSHRDLAVTKAAIPGDDGEPAGVLVVFTDVTEFRQAERATREARDAAEEASRTKTEFIANISHELRTPLQSIIGFSELGSARSGPQPRLGMMFSDIHNAGQRMLTLVNDLLDVAKIESTVGTFHLERTDLRGLVREVTAELSPQISKKQLQLQLALGDEPLVAQVDPLRVQQVLRNVLANAIRYSPLGAVLLVQGQLLTEGAVQLSVIDQGPGIPAQELESIFDAFVQSSTTKDGSGGTGLGLAISRKIVQAHGGQIQAQNNPGGGASFLIRLNARAPSLSRFGGAARSAKSSTKTAAEPATSGQA